jgi:hypothetical protein
MQFPWLGTNWSITHFSDNLLYLEYLLVTWEYQSRLELKNDEFNNLAHLSTLSIAIL